MRQPSSVALTGARATRPALAHAPPPHPIIRIALP